MASNTQMPRGMEVDDSVVDAIFPEEGPGRILARGSRDITVRRQLAGDAETVTMWQSDCRELARINQNYPVLARK